MNALAGARETNAALIDLIKTEVRSPEMVAVFAAEVEAESARESAQPKATAATVRRRLEKAEKEIANLVDAIAAYGLRKFVGNLVAGARFASFRQVIKLK
jgi:hypothetical protein